MWYDKVMREKNILVIHGIYRHYKGDYYIVEGVAKHSETGEELVIYRGLYDNGQHLYARPKNMFLSATDIKTCPGAKQTWRFELQNVPSKRQG